ncbi:MAG TPA: 50S ribosomal protein L35 [Candidatus Paceibacterota bacterium]|nr:50S ribosomal protein L35 [Candidatus Paceibacterota bacterium]
MRRPKPVKTRKSVAKRFKITGTGKVLFRGAGRRHLLQGKSSKRRRSLRKAKILGATDLYRIKQNLPFRH